MTISALFPQEPIALKHHLLPHVYFSLVAKRESWRKEVYRPTTHIHRWWATRLGTVFRLMLIDALKGEVSDVDSFYANYRFPTKIVLDPFMGSGTTLVEALKVGAKAIGVDINPLSNFVVSSSLKKVPLEKMDFYLAKLDREVGHFVRQLYTTVDVKTGRPLTVLYYFWVKIVKTPTGEEVPLFPSYVFAKDAYPKKRPEAQILCPSCWDIFTDRYDTQRATCPTCGFKFNPQSGPAPKGQQFVYDSSGNRYRITDLLPKTSPPEHRLFAVLAVDESSGKKKYQAATEYDLRAFDEARELLANMERELPLPDSELDWGRNTSQAIRYGYRRWRDFFNERQLLSLGLILRSILTIDDIDVRNQFLLIFSSALEYNNMFASFKGEGTGAVRPIFSHHILKPERVPIEGNVWGTSFSSGSFLSIYKNKYRRGKKYLSTPTDLALALTEGDDAGRDGKAQKVVTAPVLEPVFAKGADFEELAGGKANVLTLTADSRSLSFIPDNAIDAVVTDPPYFDFVNYSELSDFFYAWVGLALGDDRKTTRRNGEVQSADPEKYSQLLKEVFLEMARVLKPGAPLSFTFHHSSPYGWWAIAVALKESGFLVKRVFPVYGENVASVTKAKNRHPIKLDAIIKAIKPPHGQCEPSPSEREEIGEMIEEAVDWARRMANDLGDFDLSRGDVFVLRSAWLTRLLVNAKVDKATMLSAFQTLYYLDLRGAEDP